MGDEMNFFFFFGVHMRFSAKSNAKEKEREIYIYYTYIFKFTNNIFRRDFTFRHFTSKPFYQKVIDIYIYE